MKKRILIIEDNIDTLLLIQDILESKGYSVFTATTGNEGIKTAKELHPDLITLDIRLPDINGFEVCKALKKEKETEDIPILMLTVLNNHVDKVTGLVLGADDYLNKPFEEDELVARIKAILRSFEKRLSTQRINEPTFQPEEDIILDEDNYRIKMNGKTVFLTPKETGILKILLERKGKLVKKTFLLDTLWKIEPSSSKVLDWHISQLRKKLKLIGKQIYTIQRLGYRLV